ncbi:MAG: endonuclease, partial [Bacteroidota bacterium]
PKPNGTVWDIYSDIPDGTPNGNPPYVYHFITDQCGTASVEGDCYSREHSFPKSWFGGTVPPMYTDLFHIYPVDQYVNNRHNDNPYGDVGTANWTSLNGSKLGPSVTPGFSGIVFEPLDEYKGDIARSYFYMAVRYYTEDGGWPGSAMTTGSQLKPWAQAMMLQWNTQDPVSQKEVNRNNEIYSQIQHNRNPFIDHPEYAEMIWGSSTGIGLISKPKYILTVYPVPAINQCTILLPEELAESNLRLECVSSSGQSFQPELKGDGKRLTVSIGDLPSGFYLLILKDDQSGKNLYGKLIRQ